MVHIVLATDDNLLPHIGVVIKSLLSHTKQATFYIFTRKIKRQVFEFKMFKMPKNGTYIQIPMDNVQLGRVKLASWVTLSTMDRLFMPTILKVPKIVYIDIDCVVCDDIEELYEHPTGDCGIAAKQSIRKGYLTNIEYAKSTQINHSYLEKLSGEHPNFNAGVMVVDLDKLRKNKAQETTLNLVRATRCNDQIALASYSQGRFERIPSRWNTWVGIDERTIEKPGILHYVGGVKPWKGNTPLIEKWNQWR
jgi:lipopolysaccharide biosynthesis glycosyltransferase